MPLSNPTLVRPWLLAPDGWDTGYKLALQGASAAPLKVIVWGDSITVGVKTTEWNNNSWPGLLRAYLVAKNAGGAGADYYPCVDSQTMQGATYTYSGTPPWVVDNTNRSAFGMPFGDAPVYTDTGVTTKLTCTFIRGDVTEFDIVYLDYSASTWDWRAKDSGGNVVSSGTVTTAGSILYKRLVVTGLGTPIHTVEIGNQSVSQRMQIGGIVAYQSRAHGLWFGKIAVVGLSLTNYASTVIPADSILPWQGLYQGGTTGFGFPAAPDLMICALGVNDCQTSGRYLRAYEAMLERLCRALRRGNANASILFLATHLPDGDSSDNAATGLNNTRSYPLYVARMRRVAETFNAAFVNIHAKWGELAVANGFITADLHPTDAGNADIFGALKLAGV